MIKNGPEIAKVFNEFFVKKVSDLKANIDKSKVVNPITKLKKAMETNTETFSLRTVSVEHVEKLIKATKKKFSSGADGIPQNIMALGAEALERPLAKVINKSNCNGQVPDLWKEAVVTPVLKKGSRKDVSNYRPVSCLVVTAKIMENVVSEQVTKYMEINKFLPENQHGFRALHSTMSALSTIQKEWVDSADKGITIGVLLWDLSAAFDTVDPDL